MSKKKNIKSKKVLHVGCGQSRQQNMHPIFQNPKEWQEVRLDSDEAANPHVKGDISNMADVQSSSMDALYSSNNINHIYAHEVPKALKEFYRVTKPSGFVVMTVADAQAIALEVAKGRLEEPLYKSANGLVTAQDIQYGHGTTLLDGKDEMLRKTSFTAHTLGRKMLDAGFHNVKVTRDTANYTLWVQANKPGDRLKNSRHEAKIDGRYSQAVVAVSAQAQLTDNLEAEPKIWKKVSA